MNPKLKSNLINAAAWGGIGGGLEYFISKHNNEPTDSSLRNSWKAALRNAALAYATNDIFDHLIKTNLKSKFMKPVLSLAIAGTDDAVMAATTFFSAKKRNKNNMNINLPVMKIAGLKAQQVKNVIKTIDFNRGDHLNELKSMIDRGLVNADKDLTYQQHQALTSHIQRKGVFKYSPWKDTEVPFLSKHVFSGKADIKAKELRAVDVNEMNINELHNAQKDTAGGRLLPGDELKKRLEDTVETDRMDLYHPISKPGSKDSTDSSSKSKPIDTKSTAIGVGAGLLLGAGAGAGYVLHRVNKAKQVARNWALGGIGVGALGLGAVAMRPNKKSE